MTSQMSVSHPRMRLTCRSRASTTMGAYASISSACAYPWCLKDVRHAHSFHRWANVTLNQPCVVEQMPYIAYGSDNSEFIYVVSRCVSPANSQNRGSWFLALAATVTRLQDFTATLHKRSACRQKPLAPRAPPTRSEPRDHSCPTLTFLLTRLQMPVEQLPSHAYMWGVSPGTKNLWYMGVHRRRPRHPLRYVRLLRPWNACLCWYNQVCLGRWLDCTSSIGARVNRNARSEHNTGASRYEHAISHRDTLFQLLLQNAFRQNILQMRDTAKVSLLSLSLQGSENNTPRSTIYSTRDHSGSEDSAIPMLRRSSGLRPNLSDDGQESIIHGETPVTMPAQLDIGGWGQRSPTGQTQRKPSRSHR